MHYVVSVAALITVRQSSKLLLCVSMCLRFVQQQNQYLYKLA